MYNTGSVSCERVMLEVKHTPTDARRAAGVVISMLTVTCTGLLNSKASPENCDSC